MSTTVDQRVVEMRFDNKHFENNVSTTMSTLEKFKHALKLDGASKGLDEVSNSARRMDLYPLVNAAETVGIKFNAMWTIADQALRNITNAAMNAGYQLAKSLSIDQITAGFDKFGKKTTSVATLQAQGFSMDEVNEQLDRLNWFTDETSYNFTDMVENISKFTATGKGLTESVNAMEGIATWAALSGQNAQKASGAMYQLSQAMGSGVMRKEDYKSIQNASMDTDEFRQKALDAAVALGTLKKNADGTYSSLKATGKGAEAFTKSQFADKLTEGQWFTSDVMMKVFGDYSAAVDEIYKITEEKGMLASEVIDEIHTKAEKEGISTNEAIKALGYNFDEFALKAFEAGQKARTFGDAIDATKDAVSTGWMKTFEIIFGDAEEATELWTDLANSLWDVFAAGGEARNELLEGWKELGGRTDLIDSFWNIWEGVASVVTPIKEAFRDIFPAMTAERLFNITKAIKEFTAKLTLSETASDNLKRTFKGLFAVLDIVKQVFGAVFKAISPLFGKVDDLGGGILGVTAKIGDWLVGLNEAIEKSGFFTTAVEKIHAAFEKISNFFKPVIDGIKEFGNAVDTTAEERLGPLVTLGNFIKSIFVGIGNIVNKVFPFIVSAATGIGNVLKDLMDRISSSVQGANFDKIFDVVNGGIFATIGVYIAKMFKSGSGIFDGAAGFVENINNILEGAGDALGAFTDSLKADTLKKIATAIAILAASLFVLSIIDSEKLTGALAAITVLFIELTTAMDALGKMGNTKGLGKTAIALVALASAVFTLSLGLKIMSTMSWREMGVGLISLTVGLGALVGAVWALSMLPEKELQGSVKAIKSLAYSLLVLSVALKIMGSMSWEEMGVALISMTAALGAMIGVVWALPKEKELLGASKAISSLSKSLVVMAIALKIMGSMSWEEMAIGLISMVSALGAMIGVMWALPKDIGSKALGMLGLASALVILGAALKIMGSMSWEEIARGLVAMVVSLGALIGVMWALPKDIGSKALGLLGVASALIVLGIALKTMASMSWEEVGRGLLTLAGAFTVIGLAALILKPLVPTISALAGSLALLGLACAAIGAGVLMVGVGITALSAALAAGGLAITVFVSSLIGLIPYLIEQIGVGIIKLCEVIAGSAAAICDAFAVIIVALVDALIASVPKIVEGALVLVEELMKSLVAHTPMIVTYLFDFIIGIIDAIATKLPDLIKAGVNLLMSLFQGIVDALKSIDPKVLINGILAIGMITALMASMAACAALTGPAMVGVLGAGVVIAELAAVLAAVGGLAQIPGLDWIIGEGGNLLQTIGTAIGKFFGGIVGGFATGMSSALPQIGSDLTAFMTNASGFIEGAKSIDSSTLDGVKTIVGIIAALTAVDIMEGLTSWFTGGSSLTAFGKELTFFGLSMKDYANAVSGIDASAVTASANAAQALADMTSHIPDSGGVKSWFAGDNSIAKFAPYLVDLGTGLAAYSNAIVGFNAEAVIASANAATAIADMTTHIPNSGGVVSWFAGDNSIAKFGNELVELGASLAAYSLSISGFNGAAVIASASAAQALVDMTSHIPNEGGMVAWFTGENSVASWGRQLISLGASLAAYSLSISGFNAEAVIASASAAQALVDMTSSIPNEGGMVAWFVGENSVANFSLELVSLGTGLKGFSDAVAGINIENVTAAAQAAKSLAEMAATIPNEGGVKAWFAGENSLSKFSTDIVALGTGIKGFSDGVAGINAENVSAAAGAAKALAEMASIVPNEGGIKAWFAGENSISSFGDKLPVLGEGLKGFSDAVAGISPENVTAAAQAAKTLAEMADTAPKSSDKIIKFGENLEKFAGKLKSYFSKMAEVSGDTISSATKAIDAVKDASSKLDNTNFSSASKAIDELVKSINKMSKIKASAADGFSSAIKKLADTNVDAMIKAFKNAGPDMKNAGKDLVAKFVEGLDASESKAKKASENLATSSAKAASKMSSKFKSAGKDLGEGLIQGINSKKSAVYKAAYALGQEAVRGEKDGQKSNSPSKLTILAGNWLGEGLIIGMDQMSRKVYNAGSDLGQTASGTISSAISKISNAIHDDIDTQPTIRPVLDLSDVRSGAGAIGGMLGSGSIGVRANLGAISSMMSVRGQNGSNSDVVSAIDKLRKDLAKSGGDTYQVNGVTYDDGSNVSDAISTIVRAARIERRV